MSERAAQRRRKEKKEHRRSDSLAVHSIQISARERATVPTDADGTADWVLSFVL
jgi:hypothetical protein